MNLFLMSRNTIAYIIVAILVGSGVLLKIYCYKGDMISGRQQDHRLAADMAAMPRPFQGSALELVDSRDLAGTVGVEAIHTFTLKNTSQRPIRVAGVEVSCGCTKASVSPEDIEPGKVAALSLKFTPKAAGSLRIAGVLRVKQDGVPDSIPFELKCIGEPAGRLVAEPSSVAAPYVKVLDAPTSRDVVISSFDAKHRLDFRKLYVAEATSELDASIDQGRISENSATLRIQIPEAKKQGTFRGHVSVESSENSQYHLSIPVTWTVLGALSSNPSVIFLPRDLEPSASNIRIVVYHRNHNPVRITKARHMNSDATAQCEISCKSMQAAVDVDITTIPKESRTNILGRIEIDAEYTHNGSDVTETLRVPIFKAGGSPRAEPVPVAP
jgi:hypothetical protein